MKDYRSEDVRNVVVLGHNGSGKSSVIQSMLLETKQISRVVSAESGQSVIDTDPIEIQKGQTLAAKLIPVEWLNRKINFLDTPGYLDFVTETLSSFSAADNVLIVVDAKDDIDEGTKTAFRWATESNKPTLFFVNKMDDENVTFHKVYDDLRNNFGNSVIAFEIPIREKGVVIGSINLLSKKVWYYDKPDTPYDVPEEYQDQVAMHWEQICEAVAMTEDSLMETYFESGELTEAQILKGVSLGVRSGDIRPVYCGSANTGIGMRRLLDLITEYLPSYKEKGTIEAHDNHGKTLTLNTSEDEVFSAQVFKTVVDPFVGRISYVKVMSGVLSTDAELYNATRDENERISSIYTIVGKTQNAIGKLFAGDIGAIPKLQFTRTFDSLSSKGQTILFDVPQMPSPLLGYAIWPETKKDEDKLSGAINKICDEDIGVKLVKNTETGEQILYTMGEQHMESVLQKLRDKYGASVTTSVPKVAFRETIRKKVVGEGRHKKQTGGSGQFGHVYVEFEPYDTDDMVFETRVVGGAVPKQYFGATEQGIREAMLEGILAGYKVVGVKATLFDGKYHEVDSKEIAFKSAGRLAYLDAMPKAVPQLLEPIALLEIVTPETYTGTIMGDLNKRRGMIMSVDALENGQTVIKAEVPEVEVKRYVSELRAMSQGSATYHQEFVRYDIVPEGMVQQLLNLNK